MVELKADADLEKVAAKVAIEGGEVVTVRYSDWQLKPGESKPGAGPVAEGAPGGSPGGGEKRGFRKCRSCGRKIRRCRGKIAPNKCPN